MWSWSRGLMWRGSRVRGLVVLWSGLFSGCVVSSYCFSDQDCEEGLFCSEQGQCAAAAPLSDLMVDPDLDTPLHCTLPEMVQIGGHSCMDIYEASRPDATKSDEGVSSAYAVNREGVLPWQGVDLPTARAACRAAGKSLCKLDLWRVACGGPGKTTYAYGDIFDPTVCNSIDTYCHCDTGPCGSKDLCPYAHCYGVCGAAFRVDPTGFRPGCTNAWGVLDINGNVWELTDTDDGKEHFRGGAYNCADSERLHRCDHDGTWGPSARGFRCCAEAVPVTVDAGSPPDHGPPADRGEDRTPTWPDLAARDLADPDLRRGDLRVRDLRASEFCVPDGALRDINPDTP